MPELRKLATIVFADIAGYSAMMQEDEAAALRTLDHFREIMEQQVPQHKGEIVQYFGDGCLLSFDSAYHGLAASKALQEAYLDAGIPVRIGMHLGDVLYRSNNAYGDGVNIASRVESLGVPGSVLFTHPIRDLVKNKAEFELAFLGSFDFKNIEEPMKVYALANPGFSIPDPENIQGKLKLKEVPSPEFASEKAPKTRWKSALLVLAALMVLVLLGTLYKNFFPNTGPAAEENLASQKLSIAVLPFSNLSTNKENEFFAVGMHEDVLNKLAALKELRVMSRMAVQRFKDFEGSLEDVGKQLDVQYLVEGSVSRWEDEVKVTASLVDLSTGERLWSESYDRKLQNVFTLQGEIAREIVSKLQTNISQKGLAVLKEVQTTVVEAYDNYVQARSILSSSWYNYDNLLQAIELLNNAVEFDPGFIDGWSLLSQAQSERYGRLNEVEDSVESQDALRKAEFALNKVSELQPQGFYFHRANGYYLDIVQKEHIKALGSFNKALEMVPNDAKTMGYLAEAYFKLGQLDDAIEMTEQAYAVDNQNGRIIYGLTMFYEFTGRFAKAVPILERLLEVEPDNMHYAIQAKYFQFLADGKLASFKAYEDAVKTIKASGIRDSRSLLNNEMVIAMFNGDYETYIEAWKGKWDAHQRGHGDWSCPMILNDDANQAHLMIQNGEEPEALEIIKRAKNNITRPYHKHALCIFNKATYNPKLELMSGDTTKARKEFEATIPVVMNNDLFPRGPVERAVLLETADMVAPDQVYAIYKQVTAHPISFVSFEKICANPWVYPNLLKDPQFVQEIREDGRFVAFLESYGILKKG